MAEFRLKHLFVAHFFLKRSIIASPDIVMTASNAAVAPVIVFVIDPKDNLQIGNPVKIQTKKEKKNSWFSF